MGREANHKYLLEMERSARRNGTGTSHRYYAQRYQILWELFDYQPTTGIDNQTILNTVEQHILSMQATYEELFSLGELTISGAAQYFVNSAAVWNRFVQKMVNPTTAYPNVAAKQQQLTNEIGGW